MWCCVEVLEAKEQTKGSCGGKIIKDLPDHLKQKSKTLVPPANGGHHSTRLLLLRLNSLEREDFLLCLAFFTPVQHIKVGEIRKIRRNVGKR